MQDAVRCNPTIKNSYGYAQLPLIVVCAGHLAGKDRCSNAMDLRLRNPVLRPGQASTEASFRGLAFISIKLVYSKVTSFYGYHGVSDYNFYVSYFVAFTTYNPTTGGRGRSLLT